MLKTGHLKKKKRVTESGGEFIYFLVYLSNTQNKNLVIL